jgi:hypothetical protein
LPARRYDINFMHLLLDFKLRQGVIVRHLGHFMHKKKIQAQKY